MVEEMRKRLEEAAEKFCYDNGLPCGACASQISFGHDCMRAGYIAGAEYGYKEAIAQACKWLLCHARVYGYADADLGNAEYHYDAELMIKALRKAMEE